MSKEEKTRKIERYLAKYCIDGDDSICENIKDNYHSMMAKIRKKGIRIQSQLCINLIYNYLSLFSDFMKEGEIK